MAALQIIMLPGFQEPVFFSAEMVLKFGCYKKQCSYMKLGLT